MEQGLGKEERLRKRFQFERVYKEGKAFSGRTIRLAILANGLGANRAGFAVSKKRLKLSTQRNRVKRFLREAYRRNKHGIKPGFDIVLIGRETPPSLKLPEVEAELSRLAQKAGIKIQK